MTNDSLRFTKAMRVVHRLLLLVALVVLIPSVWLGPLDAAATQRVDAGLKRALVSFAAARALNAVISVAQGTEVSAAPAGIGVVLTPGQVLDPINDLVEQFSLLMLAASVAFGAQKVLISIGGYQGVSLVLIAVALGWVWYRWRAQAPPLWLSRSMLVLFMIRFAVPLVTVGSDALFQKFMADDYAASGQAIEPDTGPLGTVSPPPAAVSAANGVSNPIKDWLTKAPDWIKDWLTKAPDWIKDWLPKISDPNERLEKLKALVEQTTEHIVKLIVIFLLQTLVVPLVLFWALYRIGRAMLDSPKTA